MTDEEINKQITKDLIRKGCEDVGLVVQSLRAIAPAPFLPIAMAAGGSALVYLAAELAMMAGTLSEKPDPDCMLLGALMAAHSGLGCSDPVGGAYADFEALKERRACLGPPAVPPDVTALVIAARVVAYEDQSPEALRQLDQASEAFSDRVPWDDEPPLRPPCRKGQIEMTEDLPVIEAEPYVAKCGSCGRLLRRMQWGCMQPGCPITPKKLEQAERDVFIRRIAAAQES